MIDRNTTCPDNIPPNIFNGIKNYVLDHHPVGDFLTAVICNDLKRTIAHADNNSLAHLVDIVRYFYWEAPSDCWGSKEKMRAWLNRNQE